MLSDLIVIITRLRFSFGVVELLCVVAAALASMGRFCFLDNLVTGEATDDGDGNDDSDTDGVISDESDVGDDVATADNVDNIHGDDNEINCGCCCCR